MRIQSLNQSFKLASAVLAKITQRFIPLTRGHELNGSLTKYRVPRTPQSKTKDLTPIMHVPLIRGHELNGSLTKYRVPRTSQSKIKDLTPIMHMTPIMHISQLTPPIADKSGGQAHALWRTTVMIFLLMAGLVAGNQARAEGTLQIAGAYNTENTQTVFAYANAGDTIQIRYGSNLCTINYPTCTQRVRARWVAPDGTSGFFDLSPNGVFDNDFLPTGKPAGVWKFTFNPAGARTEGVLYRWNVRVNNSGGAGVNGRVWVEQLELRDDRPEPINTTLYGLAETGHVFSFTLNDYVGINSTILFDGVGNHSGDCVALNSSQPGSTSGGCGNHKLFFNVPDATMPTTATYFDGRTADDWVYPDLVLATIDVINRAPKTCGSVYAVDFLVDITGTPGATYDGSVQVIIDTNNDGLYDGNDVFIRDNYITAGIKTVPFDGLDKLGNPVTFQPLNAQVQIAAGAAHLVMRDVEQIRGITADVLRPAGGDPVKLYWDDTPINPAGKTTFTSIVDGSTGITGSNLHGWLWPVGTPLPTWGDTESIDNWINLGTDTDIIALNPPDFGDAPDSFSTLGASNGPCHFAPDTDLYIGTAPNFETDAQPSAAAATDANEDGVTSFSLLPLGATTYTVPVALSNTTGADATLCGWIDYSLDGTFNNDTIEEECVTVANGATSANLTFTMTSGFLDSTANYYARFRLCSIASECDAPTGLAANGEVEDYLIPPGTLPVTLSSFDSAQTGKRLEIDWGTASELFNSGFQLWGLDKPSQQWQPLNKWLVASGGGNSVEPQSYSKRVYLPASIEALESLGISSVDSNGKEHFYGPFEVGKRYGELASLDPIDWSDVRAQADASMTAKGYTRVYGKGYKKLASTDLNKMAADSGSSSALEFSVTTNGLYKLKAQDMLLSGSDWSKIPKGEIAILNSAGNPIARHVIAKGSGKGKAKTLGAGGSIVFYANSVDQVQGLYSGEAVYRMVRDTTKARLFNIQGKQGLDGDYSTSYTEQSWTEQQNQYLVNSVLPDPWLSAVVLSYPDKMRGAIYSVPVEADVLRDQPMELIIRAGRSSAQNAVDADNDGIQDPEHILQGIVASPSSATGYVLFDAQTAIGSGAWETRFNIAGDIELPDTGVINAGAAMTAGAGYTFSEVYVDAVGVAYSRPYVPKAGDSHLNFSAEQDEPGYRVQVPLIRGAVAVYASDGANLVKIRPESVDKARTASGERVRWISFAALQGAAQLGSTPIEYWVTNNDGYLSVANLHPTNITAQAELLNAVSGSDYLIISHPAFMGESLTGFANHKRSMGHTVSVVDYLEVVSSFAGGQSGPQGLTDYLNAVEAQTGGSLAHVLLVGGSTYDHRNYLSHDAITFIPTHYGESIASRYTPSDSLYVQDANGAQFAAIGRWPGRTMADIDKLIAATTQWDTQAIEEPSVLLIAEQTKVDEGIDFGLALDGISSILPANYVETKIYSNDELTASQAKPLIKAALNDAPQLVIYNGHGSTSQLSTRNLYNATDAVDNQASSSALWLPMSCYMTYYESTSVNTLAHQLLFSGQSVAISGASLLSSQGTNLIMNASILDGLNADNSLGASIDTAKAAANNPGTSVNWSLLGDPSIRIK